MVRKFTVGRRSLGALVLGGCLVLASCGGGIDSESYDKITVGMTLTEVEGMLGSGERQDASGTSIGASGIVEGSSNANNKRQTYVWNEGDKSIILVIENGKVASKSKKGF